MSLGLAPWQVDRAKRDLRHWEADTLAQAIEAVAFADAEVKGAAGPRGTRSRRRSGRSRPSPAARPPAPQPAGIPSR